MNPYLEFIERIEAGVEKAKKISVDATPPSRAGSDEGVASTILLFSPHPDDECIVGALALASCASDEKKPDAPVTSGVPAPAVEPPLAPLGAPPPAAGTAPAPAPVPAAQPAAARAPTPSPKPTAVTTLARGCRWVRS